MTTCSAKTTTTPSITRVDLASPASRTYIGGVKPTTTAFIQELLNQAVVVSGDRVVVARDKLDVAVRTVGMKRTAASKRAAEFDLNKANDELAHVLELHQHAKDAAADFAAHDMTSVALHELLRDWNALRELSRANSDFKDGVKQCVDMLQKVVDGIGFPEQVANAKKGR